ncbi:MAG: lipid-A-disaccharide synthase [Leptolyngbyaceae cyanobacterium bins.59]|nr:lipid-A-disaccharide synthase [Leptolyngbyaceae cyanobacterium bins.59]
MKDEMLLSPTETSQPLSIFVSTGEVSGDLQGSLLIQALKRQAETAGVELEIVALGGERMAQAGAELLGNTSGIGSLGLLEALPFILPTLQVQGRAKKYLRNSPPDLVILIDYVGPNLTLGNFIRKHLLNIPIVYYIGPQEWVCTVGSGKTTKNIVEITDLLLAIFPEEARYFERKGASVQWVGHPLIDRNLETPDRTTARTALGLTSEQTVISLLPASRRQELKFLLPLIFGAAQQIQEKVPHIHFLVPLSLETYRQDLEFAIQSYGLNATLVTKEKLPTGESSTDLSAGLFAIAASDLAITKSGTANLEIALLNVPQVVTYRVGPLSTWIADNILKLVIPFASPVNLVVMKEIVPEFIQQKATVQNIVEASLELLLNENRRQQMLADYREMQTALGDVGVCDRAAQRIVELLLERKNKAA